MKYTNKLFATIAAFSLLVMIGCGGGDDNPTPGTDNKVPGEEVTGTWVQNEAGDITGPAAASFTDFSITINTTGTKGKLDYVTSNTEPMVFPASGSFTEIPDDADFTKTVQVTRDSTVPVDFTLVSENQIRMVFTIAADSSVPSDNSRVAEVSGEYTFLLDKDTQ